MAIRQWKRLPILVSNTHIPLLQVGGPSRCSWVIEHTLQINTIRTLLPLPLSSVSPLLSPQSLPSSLHLLPLPLFSLHAPSSSLSSFFLPLFPVPFFFSSPLLFTPSLSSCHSRSLSCRKEDRCRTSCSLHRYSARPPSRS